MTDKEKEFAYDSAHPVIMPTKLGPPIARPGMNRFEIVYYQMYAALAAQMEPGEAIDYPTLHMRAKTLAENAIKNVLNEIDSLIAEQKKKNTAGLIKT